MLISLMIGKLLVYCLTCCLTYCLMNYVFSMFTQKKISTYVISFIHSIILFSYAEMYYTYSDNIMLFSAGYFMYDLLNVCRGLNLNTIPPIKQIGYIIHHIFAIVGYYCILTNANVNELLPLLTFLIGKIELSSTVGHFITIFELLGYLNHVTTIILKIINIIVWTYYRIISAYYKIMLLQSVLLFGHPLMSAIFAIYIISMIGLILFLIELFQLMKNF